MLPVVVARRAAVARLGRHAASAAREGQAAEQAQAGAGGAAPPRGRWRKPGYKAVHARSGRFSAAFRPGRAGHVALLRGHDCRPLHGRGESRKYQLRVGR